MDICQSSVALIRGLNLYRMNEYVVGIGASSLGESRPQKRGVCPRVQSRPERGSATAKAGLGTALRGPRVGLGGRGGSVIGDELPQEGPQTPLE